MLRRYVNGDTTFAVVLVVCGAYWVVGALPLGLWTGATPATGFLPFWYGILLCGLAGINLIKALRDAASVAPPEGGGARKPLLILLIVALAVGSIEVAGFVPTGFVTMMVLFVIVERRPLLPALLVSAGVTGALYLLFAVWLKVPLPMGFLGD